MGIQVEFNPDLALRNFSEHRAGNRQAEECIPEDIKVGEAYSFLKSGHRNYWFDGELPLLETKGGGNLSRPLASVKILEATHFLVNGDPFTRGRYKVISLFDPGDKEIHFESYKRI